MIGHQGASAFVIRVGLNARLTMRAKPLMERPECAGGEHELEAQVRDPVQVLVGGGADDGPRGQGDGEAGDQRPQARGIAGDVEPPAQAKEPHEERDASSGLLDVEPAGQVGQCGECDDGERGHPRASLAPGEPAREPHERDAGRERQRPGEIAGVHREHRLEEIEPVGQGGCDGRQDVDDADDERPERDHDRGLDRNRREPAKHLAHSTGTVLMGL